MLYKTYRPGKRTASRVFGNLRNPGRPAELSSIFIDTLLHEATKKRERNARRATVRDACFIYNRGGVRARCRAASGRDARVEYYARPATLLSSLSLSLSRVYRGGSLKRCFAIAKPPNGKQWRNHCLLSYHDWLNLRINSKNEIRAVSRRNILLISSRVCLRKNELTGECTRRMQSELRNVSR